MLDTKCVRCHRDLKEVRGPNVKFLLCIYCGTGTVYRTASASAEPGLDEIIMDLAVADVPLAELVEPERKPARPRTGRAVKVAPDAEMDDVEAAYRRRIRRQRAIAAFIAFSVMAVLGGGVIAFVALAGTFGDKPKARQAVRVAGAAQSGIVALPQVDPVPTPAREPPAVAQPAQAAAPVEVAGIGAGKPKSSAALPTRPNLREIPEVEERPPAARPSVPPATAASAQPDMPEQAPRAETPIAEPETPAAKQQSVSPPVAPSPPAEKPTLPAPVARDSKPASSAGKTVASASAREEEIAGSAAPEAKADSKSDAKSDLKRLQGMWNVWRNEANNHMEAPAPNSTSMFVEDSNITRYWGGKNKGATARFTIVPDADPKQIDLDFTSGSEIHKRQFGIYRFTKDGQLEISWSGIEDNPKRPRKFTGRIAPGAGWMYTIYRNENYRDPPEVTNEMKKLQGRWGQAGQPGSPVMIEEDLIQFYWGGNQVGIEGRITVNPTKDPKEIDLVITSGDPGKRRYGIYRLKGNNLEIAFGQIDVEKRPTKFTVNRTTLGAADQYFKLELQEK
jgi:uncharacterized protein (TIGR03067 family)